MALSYRSKLSFLSAVIVSAALVLRCTQSEGKSSEKNANTLSKSDSGSCEAPVNPNGDSELALLMRKMLHSSQALKELVAQGKLPDEFPEEFLKIHTAKPTDSDTKKASFDNFAGAYLDNLKALYNSGDGELKSNYNAVVNVCISCHQEHCPGPLSTIAKLKIE